MALKSMPSEDRPKETTISSWLLAQRKGSIHTTPAIVKNLRGEVSAGNRIILQWDIPAENGQQPDNRIWYCKIYRNDEVIREIYNNYNGCTDSLLVANNTFDYTISAVNYYFKESERSQKISLTPEK